MYLYVCMLCKGQPSLSATARLFYSFILNLDIFYARFPSNLCIQQRACVISSKKKKTTTTITHYIWLAWPGNEFYSETFHYYYFLIIIISVNLLFYVYYTLTLRRYNYTHIHIVNEHSVFRCAIKRKKIGSSWRIFILVGGVWNIYWLRTDVHTSESHHTPVSLPPRA